MGVLFLEHLGGKKYYVCIACDNYLTKEDCLMSTRFTSTSGPAKLFSQVVNVIHGERYARNLMTGRHFVRDVFCKRCGMRVGWFYEFAERERQEYKEGKTVLEDAMLRVEECDFD